MSATSHGSTAGAAPGARSSIPYRPRQWSTGNSADRRASSSRRERGPDHPVSGPHTVLANRLLLALMLTVPLFVLSGTGLHILELDWLITPAASQSIQWFLSSLILFFCGLPVLRGFLEELKAADPGVMLLATTALAGAYIYSAATVMGFPGRALFLSVAVLVDLVLYLLWREKEKLETASTNLQRLKHLVPDRVHLITRGGRTMDVALEEVGAGDLLRVRPGERIPVDGTIEEGVTWVDESFVTGETVRVPKEEGSPVVGGSLNGDGAISIEARAAFEFSSVSLAIGRIRSLLARESNCVQRENTFAAALVLTSLLAAMGIMAMINMLTRDYYLAFHQSVHFVIVATIFFCAAIALWRHHRLPSVPLSNGVS